MPKFKKGDAVVFNRKKVLESDTVYEFNVLSKDAMLDNLTDGKIYIIPYDYGYDDDRIVITMDNGKNVFCYQDFFYAVIDKKVFNIGDTVVFTTPDAGGHAQDDSWAKKYCTISKHYKVENVDAIGIQLQGDDGNVWWVNPNQFTLKSEYDMQKQEKQNLKPFNLERALAGDPVVIRNGRKITELRFFSTKNEHPVAGFIDGSDQLQRWTVQGHLYGKYCESDFDLFMAPVEKSGWIKIFPQQAASIKATTSCIYDNEADALKFMFPDAPTGIVVQIKWTE